MKIFILLILTTTLSDGHSAKRQRRFPSDFLFGSSSAAYQAEGGWNEGGKGENIWDNLIHNRPNIIEDRSNADIACDSYHNYKRDVEMLRELGVDIYRFSISWARILPTGFANTINIDGITYYNNLINELLKYNITPMVTIYHFDLPQKLQDLGGFTNPYFVNWFEDYATILFEYFGDRVKYWMTFNEPNAICWYGYGTARFAPMLNSTEFGTYLCAKHLILAHANVYHIYNNEFKPTQRGLCGITINVNFAQPLTDSIEDKYAAEIKKQADWAMYTDPLFFGDFPKELSNRVAKKSYEQGYAKSRFSGFTEIEKIRIYGTLDFISVNQYTANLVSLKKTESSGAVATFEDDLGLDIYKYADWVQSASSWLTKVPRSLYNVLIDLKKRYNNPPIFVTENGWSSADIGLMDDDRISYYRASLEDVLDALDDGVNIKMFLTWSLMDNFEWTDGYKVGFGLYQVDFNDPERKRTARKSAFIYKHIVKNRYIDHNYEPESLNMTIDDTIEYPVYYYHK